MASIIRSLSSRFSDENPVKVDDDEELIGSMSPTLPNFVVDENQEIEMRNASLEPRTTLFLLSFSDLTYSVKVNNSRIPLLGCLRDAKTTIAKTLLNNISGEVRDGEIMAVMGASGSGKSTLIDALANRIAKGSLKGSVKLNGEVLESRMLKTISAYVMQDDLLFPMLTVEETLMFSSEFRLPRTLSRTKKKARVQALIDQLGLRNAAKTVIGDEGHRGVSGGERRRVSIGIDIIHDPIILFLDEPTSGLDSTSAFIVVQVLQRIAKSGSVVVMSIHQPSYRIIGLLDKMIFLSRGQTVFNGSPSSLPLYFSEFGNPIPENENGTEFALDLIQELESSPAGTKGLVEFYKSWEAMKNADNYAELRRGSSLKDAITASFSQGKLVSTTAVSSFANPIWKEIIILSKRSTLNSWRTPELFGVRLATVIVTGFILATLFRKLDSSPKGARELFGFIFYVVYTIYFGCADVLPVFLHERNIFMRETAYNAYRRSSYVIAQSLVAVPSIVLLSITFALMTFWLVGLAGGASGFLFFFLVVLAVFWAGSSFVTFLSGVISELMMGYTIAVTILAYFLVLCGFYVDRSRIPHYWIWLHYISLAKYPYEAVMQSEFDDPLKCFVKGLQIFDNSQLGAIPDALKLELLRSISRTLGVEIGGKTCVTTGPDLLRNQAITELGKWSCLLITVAWGFLFRILFYFSLLLGSKNKRR